MLSHPLDKVIETRIPSVQSKSHLTTINPLQNGNIAFNKHRREDVHATHHFKN